MLLEDINDQQISKIWIERLTKSGNSYMHNAFNNTSFWDRNDLEDCTGRIHTKIITQKLYNFLNKLKLSFSGSLQDINFKINP